MLNSENITIIIVASETTEHLAVTLESLAHQTVAVGSIIITLPALAEESTEFQALTHLAGSMEERLPLTWLTATETGRRARRSLALANVPQEATVIMMLDEGISLAPEAMANLVYFWNSQTSPPAGVGCNLQLASPTDQQEEDAISQQHSGEKQEQSSGLRALFSSSDHPPGKLLVNGHNMALHNLSKSRRTEWLPGQAVAWRRDILESYALPRLMNETMSYEDLLFSYPIGREEPLFICASARATQQAAAAPLNFEQAREEGCISVLRRNLLVSTYKNFSLPRFYAMIITESFKQIITAAGPKSIQIGRALGAFEGLSRCLKARLLRRPPISICK
jgi:hypothetical protein